MVLRTAGWREFRYIECLRTRITLERSKARRKLLGNYLARPARIAYKAFQAFFTGLYVAVTGRKSWAMIPGGQKAGTFVAAVSIVLLLFGTLLIYARTGRLGNRFSMPCRLTSSTDKELPLTA